MALTPTHIMQIAEHHFAHRDAIFPSIRGQESIVAFAQEIERAVGDTALESDPRVNQLFALLSVADAAGKVADDKTLLLDVDDQTDDTSGVPLLDDAPQSITPRVAVSNDKVIETALLLKRKHGTQLVKQIIRRVGCVEKLNDIPPERYADFIECCEQALQMDSATEGMELTFRPGPAGMLFRYEPE
jgi:hypothetical protein